MALSFRGAAGEPGIHDEAPGPHPRKVGMDRVFFVYMLASKRQGTLYLGVTNDLGRRVWEHKTRASPGFTARYGVGRLVWYEDYPRPDEAIAREKALKTWRRAWKIRLIEEMNPDWQDLCGQLNA